MSDPKFLVFTAGSIEAPLTNWVLSVIVELDFIGISGGFFFSSHPKSEKQVVEPLYLPSNHGTLSSTPNVTKKISEK